MVIMKSPTPLDPICTRGAWPGKSTFPSYIGASSDIEACELEHELVGGFFGDGRGIGTKA